MLADISDRDILRGMETKDLLGQWMHWYSIVHTIDFTQDMLARETGIYDSSLSESDYFLHIS